MLDVAPIFCDPYYFELPIVGFQMALPIYESQKTAPLPFTTVLAIAAGKGGVGKSTITAQLAYALEELGVGVSVLDADFYGPSLHHLLPFTVPPQNDGNYLMPAKCGSIDIVSLAHFSTSQSLPVRAPIANRLVNQFIHKVKWNKGDVLLVDFPPGTGDIPLTLCQQIAITSAIAITSPQQVAIADVRKAMHLFTELKIPLMGVVENFSYYIDPVTRRKAHLFGCNGGKDLAEQWGLPLLAQIPLDPNLSLCSDEGRRIAPDTLSGAALKNLALTCLKTISFQTVPVSTERAADIYHVDLSLQIALPPETER